MMTGAQTDPVHIPTPWRAATRTLALAKPLFARGTRDWNNLDAAPDHEAFRHWNALRQIVDYFLTTHSLALDVRARERMVGAFRFAHDLAHDCDVTRGVYVPNISECTCPIAEEIKQLTLLCCDAQGVPCGDHHEGTR